MTRKTPPSSPENQKNIWTILKSLESTINSLPEELQTPFGPIIAELILTLTWNTQSFSSSSKKIIDLLQNQVKLLLENRIPQTSTRRNHKENVQSNQEINKLKEKIQELESALKLSETTVKFQNKKLDSQEIRINFKTAIEKVLLCQSYEELFETLESFHKSIQLQKTYFFIWDTIGNEEKEPYFDWLISELLKYKWERIVVNDISFWPHLEIHQWKINVPKKYCQNTDFTEDEKLVWLFTLWFRKESNELKKDGEIQSLIKALEQAIHNLWEKNILWALIKEVYTDGLTGIANRKMIDKEILPAVKLAIEKQQSVWLLFLDLNNFKTINDTYGHDVWDAIIIKFAQHLNTFITNFYKEHFPQSTPIIARQWWDEFQVILPEIHFIEIEKLANSFYNSLKDISHSFEKDGETIVLPIQTSIWWVVWDSQNFQTDLWKNISDFFIQSDKNLYKWKANKWTDVPTLFLSQL
jgi:diguanylate cyclase (GGDEF)-like protein